MEKFTLGTPALTLARWYRNQPQIAHAELAESTLLSCVDAVGLHVRLRDKSNRDRVGYQSIGITCDHYRQLMKYQWRAEEIVLIRAKSLWVHFWKIVERG